MKKCTTLLISDYGADADAWHKAFSVHDPEADVRTWDGQWKPAEVDAILIDTTMTSRGGFAQFKNLRWVSYLGHGAGDVLSDPTLPAGVIVTRLQDQQLAESVKLSALQSVLSHQQRIVDYRGQQASREWSRIRTKQPSDFSVVVLGMGFIGAQIANMLKDHGFSVSTWSRSKKSIPGIASCTTGAELDELLGRADFVLSILPETPSTRHLFDASKFRLFGPDCAFANLGRGSAVKEDDLVQAIATGQLHCAFLDVFETEPLPSLSPLWSNQRVIITPHAGGALEQVVTALSR
ncbi:NAD(P)-dependent oxidoreductase [Mesorhizobium sp. M1329]|uniref:NAD(P)-dependent oxidoreductase n=1 Tax=Mesorhizobium sp. M1329 TaxID=2957083 RepID=UPI00333CCBB7